MTQVRGQVSAAVSTLSEIVAARGSAATTIADFTLQTGLAAGSAVFAVRLQVATASTTIIQVRSTGKRAPAGATDLPGFAGLAASTAVDTVRL
jgi:hypothetical protein